MMNALEWRDLLLSWEADVHTWVKLNPTRDRIVLEFKTRGYLWNKGATEQEIEGCEQRIGVRLPPGYRTFLSVADGGLIISTVDTARLSRCSEIDWFAERYPDACQPWSEDVNAPVSDADYFKYGASQNTDFIRREYVPETLSISSDEELNFHLLNPLVLWNGEWEAWDLGAKQAIVERFRSFEQLMLERAASLKP
jgi:hypothetical protein